MRTPRLLWLIRRLDDTRQLHLGSVELSVPSTSLLDLKMTSHRRATSS